MGGKAIAAGVLLLAGSLAAWAAAPAPLSVLLVPFDASRLPVGERWIGDGIAELNALGLALHPGIVQIDRARVTAVMAPETWDEETVRLAARALRADAALYGRVRREPGGLVIEPLLLNLRTGGIASLPVMPLADADLLRGLGPLPALYARALAPTHDAEAAAIEKAAAPTASVKAFELFTRGQRAFYRGDREAAVDALLQAIERDPRQFPVAQYRLGVVHFALGNRWKCAAQLRAAILLDPAMPEPLAMLGDLFLGAPRSLVEQAIEAYSKAIELRPFYADAWVGLGNARAAKGDADGALSAYQKASMLDPFNADTHVRLGRIWAARGLCDAATDAYEHARTLDPRSPDVRCAP